MIRRPMLGCSELLTLDRLREISYPKLVTVKKDGVRCLIGQSSPGSSLLVPYSRAMKLLPNNMIQSWANTCFSGMDGEIIIPGEPFRAVQSKVSTRITLPFEFQYCVFDFWWDIQPPKDYLQRLQILRARLKKHLVPNAYILEPTLVETPKQLRELFEKVISEGEEGLIVRDPHGLYKQNRSTFREEWMLKMKLYEDAEARVTGMEPEYENRNPQEENELGLSKRSSHAANKHARERLGVLIGEDCKTGKEVRVGSGFTRDQKIQIWKDRRAIISEGRVFTYKFHAHGIKDKPRAPIFKGFRFD